MNALLVLEAKDIRFGSGCENQHWDAGKFNWRIPYPLDSTVNHYPTLIIFFKFWDIFRLTYDHLIDRNRKEPGQSECLCHRWEENVVGFLFFLKKT